MGPEILSLILLSLIPMAVEAPVPPKVAWREVATNTEQHLGQLLRFHVQAHSRPEVWEPYLTRFSPGGYVALRAWSDDQLPWIEQDYHDPQVVVFARRGSGAARRLEQALPHQRFVLACIPREVQAGMVWIEVVGAKPTREQLPEGSVLHVEKALDLLEREAPGLAREQLVRALAAPLPKLAREKIAVLVATCDRRLAAVKARNGDFKRRVR
jgi:hypothetical protein